MGEWSSKEPHMASKPLSQYPWGTRYIPRSMYFSYPSHPAVGKYVCNPPGSIVFLRHTQHLLDVSKHRAFCSLREAEIPRLAEPSDATASKQTGPEDHPMSWAQPQAQEVMLKLCSAASLKSCPCVCRLCRNNCSNEINSMACTLLQRKHV